MEWMNEQVNEWTYESDKGPCLLFSLSSEPDVLLRSFAVFHLYTFFNFLLHVKPCLILELMTKSGWGREPENKLSVQESVYILQTSFPFSSWLFFFLFDTPPSMRISGPQPEIEPVSPAVEMQSLNHQTAREVPLPFPLNPWKQSSLKVHSDVHSDTLNILMLL